MAAIQEISARIGRVTGQGIAGNLREHYSRLAAARHRRAAARRQHHQSRRRSRRDGRRAAAADRRPGAGSMSCCSRSAAPSLQIFSRYQRYVVDPEMADAVAVRLCRDRAGRRRAVGPGRLRHLRPRIRAGSRITSSRSSRCSARRSAPICSSGRPPRRPRTSGSIPTAHR